MLNKEFKLKIGLAEMLKGGVIMDVTNPDQAKIAEDAGAVAVMALERIPSDIRADGGVARMSNPKMIRDIQAVVSVPVMAKCRIGHFSEAQILQSLGVDFIDESEVLTPADDVNHVWKHGFKVPFVCGCRNLGEALRKCKKYTCSMPHPTEENMTIQHTILGFVTDELLCHHTQSLPNGDIINCKYIKSMRKLLARQFDSKIPLTRDEMKFVSESFPIYCNIINR